MGAFMLAPLRVLGHMDLCARRTPCQRERIGIVDLGVVGPTGTPSGSWSTAARVATRPVTASRSDLSASLVHYQRLGFTTREYDRRVSARTGEIGATHFRVAIGSDAIHP
jgi:hypothetical protein